MNGWGGLIQLSSEDEPVGCVTQRIIHLVLIRQCVKFDIILKKYQWRTYVGRFGGKEKCASSS